MENELNLFIFNFYGFWYKFVQGYDKDEEGEFGKKMNKCKKILCVGDALLDSMDF